MQFSTGFSVECVENPPFFVLLMRKTVENSVESGENPFFIAFLILWNHGGISHCFNLKKRTFFDRGCNFFIRFRKIFFLEFFCVEKCCREKV